MIVFTDKEYVPIGRIQPGELFQFPEDEITGTYCVMSSITVLHNDKDQGRFEFDYINEDGEITGTGVKDLFPEHFVMVFSGARPTRVSTLTPIPDEEVAAAEQKLREMSRPVNLDGWFASRWLEVV